MAAVTICSYFGAPQNKVNHCFRFVNTRIGATNWSKMATSLVPGPPESWSGDHLLDFSSLRVSDHWRVILCLRNSLRRSHSQWGNTLWEGLSTEFTHIFILGQVSSWDRGERNWSLISLCENQRKISLKLHFLSPQSTELNVLLTSTFLATHECQAQEEV